MAFRKIKVRGKITRGDESKIGTWAHGDMCSSYLLREGKYLIWDERSNFWSGFYVNGDTLGQFTGMCDKNGTEIYEGDIVVRDGKFYIVKWYVMYSAFAIFKRTHKSDDFIAFLKPSESSLTEVVGNIYDNPELVNPNDNGKTDRVE